MIERALQARTCAADTDIAPVGAPAGAAVNATDVAALAAYPEIAHVVALRDCGWRFLPVRVDGELVRMDGFCRWPNGWTDGIRIRSTGDVLGIRVAPGEPPGITWESTGDIAAITCELLALPMPDDRLAPRLVCGSAPALWSP